MTDIEKKLNPWEANYEQTVAVQGESESRTLEITIVDRRGQTDGTFSAESIDRPVDLTNASVRLYCHKPDGTVTFSDGTITDADNGVASFILPYQATIVAGYVTCEIMITWPDNSTLKAVGLNLNVQESNLDDAVESSSEYSALVVALGKADTAATTAAQAAVDAQTAVTNANGAITAITAKETEITTAENARQTSETARQTAETSRSDAENVRETAEYERVNAEATRVTEFASLSSDSQTATAEANTAADRANTAAQNAEDAIAGQLDPAIDARIAAKTGTAGGIADYDGTHAHIVNAEIHVTTLACTKSGTVYALTGLSATSGKVPVMFAIDTAFAAGDTVTIDGTAYAIQTRDGSTLTAGAWAAGAITTGIVDIDAKTLTVGPATPHTKADIGLGNVDNTADANKSVSYAATAGSAPANGGTAADTTTINSALTLSTAEPTDTLAAGKLWGVYDA